MAYSVDLIYSKNQDLSNPSTETESGQPSEMELTNLDSNQRYYTKAVLKNDGVTEDESDIETFQTIPAGVITLEHISTVRSGYGYDVTYRYTSTYAPSSAILSTNSTNFQGVVDSAQHTVSFWVTGLTPGTAYLTQVTMTDIYTESVSVQGSIVATVVNEIRITDTESTEDEIECFLDYILDDGFQQGYVEYWEADDDPSTDQPQGHFYFSNGDTSVICDNLSSGTEYQLRATVLQPNSNSVESTIVRASTEAGYDSKYFTVKNVSGQSNTISFSGNQSILVYVSTDGGTTWNSHSGQNMNIGTLAAGASLQIKHTGVWSRYQSGATYYTTIKGQRDFEVSGNIASLVFGDDFTGTKTASTYFFNKIFYQSTHLVSAENLYLGAFTTLSASCFYQMFQGCTALTTPPELPATTIANYCYTSMFQGCTALTTAPELPATTLAERCYSIMFNGCTALTTAPELPATTLATGCYYQMFKGCSSLDEVPELPATTLVDSCYYNMFQNCTSLERLPIELPAATLATNCYYGMFDGCTSLTNPPDMSNVTSVEEYSTAYMFNGCTSLEYCADMLDLTTVSRSGMMYMYQNCTSLEESTDLSGITNVGPSGMYYMFNGCSNLTSVYAPTVSWVTGNFTNWMANVAASGTFYVDSEYASTVPLNSVSGCPTGWSICVLPIPEQSDYFRITNVSTNNNAISIYDNGTEDHVTVGVSTDGGTTWTNYTSSENGTVVATLQPYKSLIMRHTGRMGVPESDARHQIGGSGAFDVSGNIASLTHGDNFDIGEELQMPDYAFYKMLDSSNVRSARYLYFDSFGEVTRFSLKGLFAYSSLVECPESMTTISEFGTNCMESFAQGCWLLKTVPEMNPTEINDQAFVYAFYGCSSLTDASLIDFSGVGSIEQDKYRYCCCQQMFEGCSNLVTPPPYLPEIASDGWAWFEFLNMFKGCSSLTSVPELNSGFTSVGEASFQEMFADCSSLVTGMDIRAITTCRGDRPSALNNMYAGCSNLTTAYAVNISNYYSDENAYHWLSNVAASGTLYCPSVAIANQMPINSVDGCPTGWAMQVGDTKILTVPDIVVNSNTGTITVTGVIPTGSGAELQYKESGASYRAYTEPLLMNNYTPPLTIYARNYTSTTGWMSSAEVRETITKYTLANPVIGYNSSTSRVTITYSYDSFANASVYYTTDGTTPTSASTLYAGTFVASTGTTVKAIAISGNSNWYNNSGVVEVEVGTVVDHQFVHLDGITTGEPPYFVGTGVLWNDPGIHIEIGGRTTGHETGWMIVGHMGVADSNSGDSDDNADIRLFNIDGGYFDYTGSRGEWIGFTGQEGEDWELEIGNNYVKDILNNRYLYQGEEQRISNPNAEIFVNISTWWLNYLQIYDSNNHIIFDGYPAELNGISGIYDDISGELFYNANYPAVCEDIG